MDPLTDMKALKDFWRLAKPYWSSEEKTRAYAILIFCVALSLLETYISIRLNEWNNQFYDALQHFDKPILIHSILLFFIYATLILTSFGYQSYLIGLLSIRWQRWYTHNLIDHWLKDKSYYNLQLSQSIDNPDQRIAEDVSELVSGTINLFFTFLTSFFSLIAFGVILWNLSGSLKFNISDHSISIPGYVAFFAIFYAFCATWINYKIGNKLAPLNYQQQKFNANFRYNLVRLRESAEQVALLQGEPTEKERFKNSFQYIFDNYLRINKHNVIYFSSKAATRASIYWLVF